MIIHSIRVHIGIQSKLYQFSESMNLIHSNTNSVGKTTLLRFLLYGLGYNIPPTAGLSFNNETYTTVSLTRKGNSLTIKRHRDFATIENHEEHHFSLPSEVLLMQREVFGTQNDLLLENLLGTFYIDQDKGWTLLNRGKVIGNNSFYVEPFIASMYGSEDLARLLEKQKQLDTQYGKYKKILDLVKYKTELLEEYDGSYLDTGLTELIRRKDALQYHKNELKMELKRVSSVLRENEKFGQYIEDMKMSIKYNEQYIPVDRNNIVGFDEMVSLLTMRKRRYLAKISEIDKQIVLLEKQLAKSSEYFGIEEELGRYQESLSKIEIDQIEVARVVQSLSNQRKKLKKEIKAALDQYSLVQTSITKRIIEHAEYLDLSKYLADSRPLFTSKLSSLSGRVLSQMVFAYKLAYISEVKRVTGISLPVIIDSPRNNEITQENANQMLSLLASKFSDHQILISSVFEFPKFDVNTIHINKQLMENSETFVTEM